MMDKIKSMKLNVTASAVLTVILGGLLLFCPEDSINLIGRVIAILLIISGAMIIITQVANMGFQFLGVMVGGIVVVIGIWLFVSPHILFTIIPIVFGVLLVVHGVQDLMLAVEGVKASAPNGWLNFLFAVLNIVLGLLCVGAAFNIVSIATRLIGCFLIYDGVSDMFIVHKVNKANKNVVDSTIVREEDVF